MLRKTLIWLWLLFPVAVAGYHFNYGEKQVMRERAFARLCEIREMERAKEPDWPAVVEAYGRLAEALPPDEDPAVMHQIRLATARARMEMLELDKAIEELTRLLQETAATRGENDRLTRAVREQLGKAFYYAAWTLKSHNAPETQWRPFAERSRQLFRRLAELENPAEYERYEARIREEFQKALAAAGDP